MMIYDCFPFFNELDILEIRLQELNDVVDKFVLVEATKTFQKKEKPLYFEENRHLFSDFEDKIIHIVVDKYPNFFTKFRIPTPWDYDNHQKNQVVRGLTDCKPGDTVIISDLDEIPRSDKVKEYKDADGIKVFQQRHSNFFLNCIATDAPDAPHLVKRDGVVYWRGSVMLDYADFTSFKEVRMQRDQQTDRTIQVEEGGWHFSFLGGEQQIRLKLDSWAHTREKKYNPDELHDPQTLKRTIEEGKDLFGRGFTFKFFDLDESYPKVVLSNPDRYSKYVR